MGHVCSGERDSTPGHQYTVVFKTSLCTLGTMLGSLYSSTELAWKLSMKVETATIGAQSNLLISCMHPILVGKFSAGN